VVNVRGSAPRQNVRRNPHALSVVLINRDVDWSRLSVEQKKWLALVALPHSEGLSYSEIAEQLGRSPAWVAARMKELRDALRPSA
jgi:O6-methylguanine-DNA--protein-cysteine methyltransferase